MAGCFGNSMEDRAMQSELDRHLDKMEAADKREEAIQELAEASLQEGGDFYPFDARNFNEAINNLPESEMLIIASFAHTAHQLKKNEFAQAACTQALLQFVTEYWRKVAVKHYDATYEG